MNAEEIVTLSERGREEGAAADDMVSVWMEDKLGVAAAELFRRHGERLPWIAVTNGGLPAYIFSQELLGDDGAFSSFWRCDVSSFVVVVQEILRVYLVHIRICD